MHRHRPFSRATWFIYLFLVAIRLLSALAPGYIHPDEYFQSAEITTGNIFGIDVNVPWEYKPELPCRSILIPAITTGLPYLVLKAWLGSDPDHYVTTRALFLTQRLAFFLISLIIDWAVVRMARQIRRSPSIALLLVSSSYVTLAYHTHPFSNAIETVVLALCATLLGTIIQKHESSAPPTAVFAANAPTESSTALAGSSSAIAASKALGIARTGPAPTPAILSFGLGILFSVGIFTRITFVLYGFPLGVTFLYLTMKASFKHRRSWSAATAHFLLTCVPLALGLGFMSAIAILIDSIYFRKLVIHNSLSGTSLSLKQLLLLSPRNWVTLSYKGTLTVTMLNNLRYNLDEKNLAQHGLHPRFFHLLLNFPVLFVNLAWIGVVAMMQKIRLGQWRSESKLVTALAYSGICGISFLSAMPHQEARFLTPLILPLVISLSGRISKLGRRFWPLWLLANGVLAVIFGLFHQSGLVPAMELVQRQSLGFQDCKEVSTTQNHMLCLIDPQQAGRLHVEDGMNYTTHVIFYKTYLPPYHLLGFNSREAHSHGVNLEISDWREKSQEDLIMDLTIDAPGKQSVIGIDKELLEGMRKPGGQRAVLFRKTGPKQFERTILIAPATVDFSNENFFATRDRFSWHANFDHLDILLQRPWTSLYLNIFYI